MEHKPDDMEQIKQAIERLQSLREDLFARIGAKLELDGHCKSVEGEFSIVFPDYHCINQDKSESWAVTLYCYKVGPSRSYSWQGDTLMEAVKKVEDDVRGWIEEDDKYVGDRITDEDVERCRERIREMMEE